MDTTPVRSLLTRLRAECRPLYQTGRIAPDLVKHRIGDLSGEMVYTYKVRPYEAPPAGRVL